VCAQHAAEFSLENGLCVKGSCLGMKLEPVSIELTDDNVLLKD
jgi:nitrite reductase/ring-hydroxylating ferredoxin subunit